MKLVTFNHGQKTSIGKIIGDRVIDLCACDPYFPNDMKNFLNAGQPAIQRAQAIDVDAVSYSLENVQLQAPVPNPGKFLAIGMNYKKHAEEARLAGVNVPEHQVWFNKQVSCINGPYSPVHMPRVSTQLDYEAELGVVIGKRCRHISVQDARSVVAGYLCCNDVSVRDWQLRTQTMTLGKSFDTTGPVGPWIVTDDEISDPMNLNIRMKVNGEIRQEVNTSEMVFNIWQQISYLSTVMTLEPGDLIATGTPSGVGAAMKPPRFLKVGDVMRVEIDGIGCIENIVINEPT